MKNVYCCFFFYTAAVLNRKVMPSVAPGKNRIMMKQLLIFPNLNKTWVLSSFWPFLIVNNNCKWKMKFDSSIKLKLNKKICFHRKRIVNTARSLHLSSLFYILKSWTRIWIFNFAPWAGVIAKYKQPGHLHESASL